MGKAVPRSIKMRVETLLEKFPERFTANFEKNKQVLGELDIELSRFDRNMIAGFLTRQIKAQKKS